MSHLEKPTSSDPSEAAKRHGHSTSALYRKSLRNKILIFLVLLLFLPILGIYAIAVGHYDLSLGQILDVLLGLENGTASIVVWNIRMPRIAASIVTGCALGLSGAAMQSLLRNPLASPFTLGVSQGAAFGAAFSIVILGAGISSGSGPGMAESGGPLLKNIYLIAMCAFSGAMMATAVILLLARFRNLSPEGIILSGIAMSSLFTSGTILIQYFAAEVELASVVFWTFGDVARSNWPEIGFLALAVTCVLSYFIYVRWDLNAVSAGEETARSLGVHVDRLRTWGMLLASLAAALATALHGVIAFLGLLAPHIGRRITGADHRFLIPYSCLIGAILLLLADTAGRLLVGSGSLPVGVLTSFMGAPLFLYLLIRERKR